MLTQKQYKIRDRQSIIGASQNTSLLCISLVLVSVLSSCSWTMPKLKPVQVHRTVNQFSAAYSSCSHFWDLLPSSSPAHLITITQSTSLCHSAPPSPLYSPISQVVQSLSHLSSSVLWQPEIRWRRTQTFYSMANWLHCIEICFNLACQKTQL